MAVKKAGKQEPRKYRRYTEQQWREAVADVATLGLTKSATKHGVTLTTLGSWVSGEKRPRGWTKAWSSAIAPVHMAAPTVVSEGEPASEPSKASVPIPAPAKATATAKAKRVGKRYTPGQARAAVVAGAAVVSSAQPEPTTTEPVAAAAPRRRVAKIYTPSQRAEMLEYAAEHGISATSTKFKTSRFSIYDWRTKVEKAANGEGASPTSGPDPSDIEAKRDREILDEWHLHPGLGPSQIHNQLRRSTIKVSTHTVRRVMEDAGYRPPKVVRQKHDGRYEAVRPNHMWHCDYVQRYINHATTFTLIFIDDYSRYVVGYGVDDAERADMAIATFEEAVQRHGRPEILMNDGGSAFWSWRGISRLTNLLTEMGVDQITAKNKELNGKSEVFNANLQKEFYDVHRFHDVTAMRRGLGGHLHWYNHGRTHHALGGLLVPADRYYGRADEVLARIETGGGREKSLDTLDLRDRSLDLFKVISKDGVPEVWLFGKKLV